LIVSCWDSGRFSSVRTYPTICDYSQAINPAAIPRSAQEKEISIALYLSSKRQARTHPFIERLIGTVRREFLDQTLFWNADDLERKLADFRIYYNHHRTHSSLGGDMPAEVAGGNPNSPIKLSKFRW